MSFFLTVKALKEFFFSNRPPSALSKVKWATPKHMLSTNLKKKMEKIQDGGHVVKRLLP